jgi:anti-anti-sigma factor
MRIEHRQRGDVTIVTLEGEFDFHDVTAAGETIGAFIDGGARRLVFDLSRLRFISSGGIGYFSQTARRLKGEGGELVLAGAPEAFGWVVQTLGIDRVIRVFPDEQEALGHFTGDVQPEVPPGAARASP